MKRSTHVRLLLMGTATIALAACDDSEPAGIYSSLEECVSGGFYSREQCQQAFEQAKKEHPQVAPKYASREACEADFGPGRCEAPATAAPAAGAAPGTQAQSSSSSGSFWMPLMMGYMVGRVVDNLGNMGQPLYRPNQPQPQGYAGGGGNWNYSAGSWRTAGNVDMGTSTGRTTVNRDSLRSSTPTSTTVQRGGFGARASAVGVHSSSS